MESYYTTIDPQSWEIYPGWYPSPFIPVPEQSQIESDHNIHEDIPSNPQWETILSSPEKADASVESVLPLCATNISPAHVDVFSAQELQELSLRFSQQPSRDSLLNWPLQPEPITYSASNSHKRRRVTYPAKDHESFFSERPLPNEPVEITRLRLAVIEWLKANPDSISTSFAHLKISPPVGSANHNFLLALMRQPEGQRSWNCYGCKFETPRSDRAEGHMRAHLEHKPYLCEGEGGCGKSDCHARFTSKKDLTTHCTELRKPKVHCEYCQEPQLSKNLKRHVDKCRLKHPSKSPVQVQAKLAQSNFLPTYNVHPKQHIFSSPYGANIYSQAQSSLLGQKRKRE